MSATARAGAPGIGGVLGRALLVAVVAGVACQAPTRLGDMQGLELRVEVVDYERCRWTSDVLGQVSVEVAQRDDLAHARFDPAVHTAYLNDLPMELSDVGTNALTGAGHPRFSVHFDAAWPDAPGPGTIVVEDASARVEVTVEGLLVRRALLVEEPADRRARAGDTVVFRYTPDGDALPEVAAVFLAPSVSETGDRLLAQASGTAYHLALDTAARGPTPTTVWVGDVPLPIARCVGALGCAARLVEFTSYEQLEIADP